MEDDQTSGFDEQVESLCAGTRYRNLGYRASKDINMRLVWLRAILDDGRIPVMPPHVQICSSYRCNIQCRFCGGHASDSEHRRLNRKEVMTPERLKNILHDTWPTAYTWSVASSGEFFVQRDIVPILEAARPYRSRPSVTTNGMAMNPEILAAFMPNACTLRVSMASGVQSAYEFFHKYGNFPRLVNNIRTLTRANELVPPEDRVDVGMYGPILVSTMRELAYRVRVVKGLGMNTIGSTSFLLFVDLLAKQDPRWMNERGELYPGLWNACRKESVELAEKLGVTTFLHRRFKGTDPDPDCEIDQSGLMFPGIVDVMKREPSVSSHLDNKKIERDAAMIADRVKTAPSLDVIGQDEAEHAKKLLDILGDVLSRHRKTLAGIFGDPETTSRICWRLELNANILPGIEWRPCCFAKYRIPVAQDAGITETYNSAPVRKFASDLTHGTIPDDCSKCRDLATVPTKRILMEALQPGLITDARAIYDGATIYVAK